MTPEEEEETTKWANELSKQMADQGKLIEAGWAALRALVIPANAPPIQVSEMRMAFFAGAQHLFASIMCTMDADSEPTDADMHRMDLIDAELNKFAEELKQRL